MTIQDRPLAGRRVLVIEDEYLIAKELAAALSAHGAQVVGPIGTLGQAKDRIAKGGIDAAALDLSLQDEMAFEVADSLIQLRIPFLFTTGYGAEAIPKAYAHVLRVEKPCNFAELVRHLTALCFPAESQPA